MIHAKHIAAAVAATQLSGCFGFFYIPGSVIDRVTGNVGNVCIGESAKVGDRLTKPDGTAWVVTAISGRSYRCDGKPGPILATGEPA